jgi:cytochrome c biogenesis protein CcmG, thiol:disulfide interchange protein DsbE
MNQFNPTRWKLFSILILLGGALWVWASAAAPDAVTAGQIPAPRKGFLAPDFALTDQNGSEYSLSDLRGQAVLVNMWASWCTPCRAEMPAMQTVYQDYHERGFEILAVNTTFQDDPNSALSFANELGLTFPLLWDIDGSTSSLYQIRAMPTSFFVKRDGTIDEVVIGGPMAEALLRVRIERLLEDGR